MAAEYLKGDQLRADLIHRGDLAGPEIRDCQVSGLNIVDCSGSDVSLSGNARLLPEAALHEQVRGEWSLDETHRHLLFAGDAWLGNAVLEEGALFHPLSLPSGGMPPDAAPKLRLTVKATPTLEEVLAPRLARAATMRRVIDRLTEAELDRVCGRKPADPFPNQEYVGRDLAVLEASA